MAYLDGLPPHTRVGLFRLGREVIDVLHDFTDDVASLRAQVAKMDLVRPEEFAVAGLQRSRVYGVQRVRFEELAAGNG